MTTKLFNVLVEIEDFSESDGEDIEMVVDDILREHLPEDLKARILEVTDESVR